MKGISLAIETIVFIILAVTVLTVLLFFFTSQAGPAQIRFEDEQLRTRMCSAYLQHDPTCRDTSSVEGEKIGDDDILSELGEVCNRLDVRDCSGSATQTCIQRCCNTFCPTVPPR